MRSQSDFESGNSQAISARAWLYVGALAMGFWLASLADFDPVPALADDLPIASDGSIVAGEEPAAGARPATDRGGLRALNLDSPPRVGTRAAQ